MCGIIGYSGKNDAGNVILNGLHSLEYRGYDSAGMSISGKDEVVTIKCKGRVDTLEKMYNNTVVNGNCGIGHTRWATHGAPSQINAHPHESQNCVIVHNGIIENYNSIKKELINEGYIFSSETDSECIAHLADKIYKECHHPKTTLMRMCDIIDGSYAIAVIFKDKKEELWAVKKNNPLVATFNENGTYIASDIPALLPYSNNFIRPDDNEILCLNGRDIILYDVSGNIKNQKPELMILDNLTAQKDGYDHFMLKEIYEQPLAIKRAVKPLITADYHPDYSKLSFTKEQAVQFESISIIGCGSATHAGLVAKYIIEKLANIPVYVTTASEYRYLPPITANNTLTIAVSQSGETADTLSALRLAKEKGDNTLAIVNVVGSAISKESDNVIYTNAGPEIAVATTKGYTSQLAVFYILAIAIASAKRTISDDNVKKYIKYLSSEIPDKIIEVLNLRDKIKCIAKKLEGCKDLYFIGRGLDSYTCVECSLKLKEISYIHSESYAAGELKHGTLSLIEDGVPVIAVCTDDEYAHKMMSNIQEVSSRGGRVIYVSNKRISSDLFKDEFIISNTENLFSPFLTVVFSQLLSYEVAVLRGCDVDHPRNLAKSVTVE